jgi:hypothetical protein
MAAFLYTAITLSDIFAYRPFARQRPQNKLTYNSRCYVMAATDTHSAMKELLAVFCVRSMPSLYNEDQRPLQQTLES